MKRVLSSVGRTLVSKIRCRGFKSFRARFSLIRGFYFYLTEFNKQKIICSWLYCNNNINQNVTKKN